MSEKAKHSAESRPFYERLFTTDFEFETNLLPESCAERLRYGLNDHLGFFDGFLFETVVSPVDEDTYTFLVNVVGHNIQFGAYNRLSAYGTIEPDITIEETRVSGVVTARALPNLVLLALLVGSIIFAASFFGTKYGLPGILVGICVAGLFSIIPFWLWWENNGERGDLARVLRDTLTVDNIEDDDDNADKWQSETQERSGHEPQVR